MGKNRAAASGIGLGVIVAWAWNSFVFLPGYGPEMPAEVSAAVAVSISRLLDRFDDDRNTYANAS